MDEMSLVKPFLDENGRLKQFPAKRKKQLAALAYLSKKFTPGKNYTEKEVNAILLQWHTFGDPATLRRDLYDAHFLNRMADGSAYWRESDIIPGEEKK